MKLSIYRRLRSITLLAVALASSVYLVNPSSAATYASGSLAFDATGPGCSIVTPSGYLAMSPGVKPTGGDTFTVEAVVRSRTIANENAVVLIGAQTSNGALSIRNRSSTVWSVDLSGDSRITFRMTDEVMANNTWYQLTLVGDSSGISMWINGNRLRSSAGDQDWPNRTIVGASGQTGYIKQMSATPDVYKFHTPISASSLAVGAWATNSWCSGGFDLSNLRFTDTALFSSSATSVTFPETPLQNVAGTRLLINTTAISETVTSTDNSGIQTITNPNKSVTATVDTNTAVITVTTPPQQTVAPGQAVSCAIGSTGGAVTYYAVSPTPGNGLSFDTSTGLLSGIPTSLSSATTYVITGYNNSGSVSTSCTITVSAPANVVSVPSPQQRSEIFSISPLTCYLGVPTEFVISGRFDEALTNISINQMNLPINSWRQSESEVAFTFTATQVGEQKIELYNGSIPLLAAQRIMAISKPVTPLPIDIPKPSENTQPIDIPKTSGNTQPNSSTKKIATLKFSLGASAMTAVQRREIASIVKLIRKSTVTSVLLYGHSDIQPGVDNAELSKKRAKSVRAAISPLLEGYILKMGWFAATKPAVKGNSQSAYAENRRVEVWVK